MGEIGASVEVVLQIPEAGELLCVPVYAVYAVYARLFPDAKQHKDLRLFHQLRTPFFAPQTPQLG